MNLSVGRVTHDVVGRNPAYPCEQGESLENVSGEEVPHGTSNETICEEAFSAHAPSVANASINLGVKRREQGCVHQVGGPDHRAYCSL